MNKKITIATRQSPMALAQTQFVQQRLQAHYPEIEFELLGMTTKGDQLLNQSLAKIGGKGLFVKELERALLDKRADLAVHSCKDMPMDLPEGLCLSTILKRDDPRDALVSQQYDSLQSLPERAIVGTSSLRRKAQLLQQRPDLQIKFLRGNANTRLAKLAAGDYDAIILATAGLERIGHADKITEYLSLEQFPPAVAQGALALECRSDDAALIELLQVLHDEPTAYCVKAERAVSKALNASCNLPLAAHATLDEQQLRLTAVVASPDGDQYLEAKTIQDKTKAPELAAAVVVEQLLSQGAKPILEACLHESKS